MGPEVVHSDFLHSAALIKPGGDGDTGVLSGRNADGGVYRPLGPL